jgi:hypothetical protein
MSLREELQKIIADVLGENNNGNLSKDVAEAVLSKLPVGFVKAEALREAANRLDELGDGELDAGLTSNWLKVRADRLEGE